MEKKEYLGVKCQHNKVHNTVRGRSKMTTLLVDSGYSSYSSCVGNVCKVELGISVGLSRFMENNQL